MGSNRAEVAMQLGAEAKLAGWVAGVRPMVSESAHSRRLAHLGVVAAITALVIYITWRIFFTLPRGGFDLVAAWLLVAFEAFPVIALVIRMVTLWNIDTSAPTPVTAVKDGQRVAVFIPTYNEPLEVLTPTVAAACALQPAHETWVLDDGDRSWVELMCAQYGARYVRRDVHDHAKAGNMNHALDLLAAEMVQGADPVDIIGVLDCDHVPLPTFLTDTLGWFDDPGIALVQAPQAYYNTGAFDDDGDTGEQGVFFHTLLPGRNHDGAGPFWCGSTSLIRIQALREVGGISTATIVEDMHTTLALIRAGWKTVYQHQIIALGLAPSTPDQYLLQRRRWGMGSMQVLTRERLWGAKRWLSWRNYYEYLSGTMWWLEGVGTALAFLIPALVLISGAQVSTADPLVFVSAFLVMLFIRLWGVRRLFRLHMHWPTAFALRILRVPIGLSCLWWLMTRRTLDFQVTPKAGAEERLRGRVPTVVYGLIGVMAAVVLYAVLGLTGWVPWRTYPASTVASSVWLALAWFVLIIGVRRIRDTEFATSRRNAHRFPVPSRVRVEGVAATVVDMSVGGAAVTVPAGVLAEGDRVEVTLPGAAAIAMRIVRIRPGSDGVDTASLRVPAHDWEAFRIMSLWLFHTPAGVVDGLPFGVPAVAARSARRSRPSALARQYGRRPILTDGREPAPRPQAETA